jgi:hypothetical protein
LSTRGAWLTRGRRRHGLTPEFQSHILPEQFSKHR